MGNRRKNKRGRQSSSAKLSPTTEKADHQQNDLQQQALQDGGQALHIQSTLSAFTGPLPPPEDFKKYEENLPGATNRILSMAEKEQQIRSAGQAGMIANDSRRINYAMFLGIFLLIIAGIATWNGNAVIAVPLGLAGVISTIIRYIFSRRH